MVAPSCLTPERDIDHLIRMRTDPVYADICRQVGECLTDDLVRRLERTPKRRQRKQRTIEDATEELQSLGTVDTRDGSAHSTYSIYRMHMIFHHPDCFRPQCPKDGDWHKTCKTLEEAHRYIDRWLDKLGWNHKIPAPDDESAPDAKPWVNPVIYYRGCNIFCKPWGWFWPEHPKTRRFKSVATLEEAKNCVDQWLQKPER